MEIIMSRNGVFTSEGKKNKGDSVDLPGEEAKDYVMKGFGVQGTWIDEASSPDIVSSFDSDEEPELDD